MADFVKLQEKQSDVLIGVTVDSLGTESSETRLEISVARSGVDYSLTLETSAEVDTLTRLLRKALNEVEVI